MRTHLKLENFKIWRSTGPTRLAPITLLLGTNSSGKSSLIQSLLLIRQTVKGETEGQAKELLRRLVANNKIELRGAGRASAYIESIQSNPL